MLHRPCLAALPLITCLVLAGSVRGGYKTPFVWEPVTEADWAVTADSAKKIHDAAMIFERVHIDDSELRRFTVKELGRLRSYRSLYRRVRILSAAGREWGDVDVPLFHVDQEIEQIQGRTILRDGSIMSLQPDQIHEKEVVKTDDDKYKQTSFSLPGVTEDCIVEYIIVCKAPYSSIEWLVQKDIPLLKFSYDWKLVKADITPELYELVSSDPTLDFTVPNYLWLNPTSRQNLTQLPNIKEPKELLFESGDIPPFEEEPFPMPENSLKDRLVCYYGSKASPSGYWGAWSYAIAGRAKSFCEKNKRVREIVETFKDLPDEAAKIKAAYDWVQQNIINLTYVDLRDEKDSTKKVEPKDTRTVDDVIKYGYGWRIDIDRLFWDMLREMNIDAKFGYAKDRFDDLFIDKGKYWQFDRTVVAIPTRPYGYQFFTPGLPCTPAHLVPWYLGGVTALLADADEYLVTIPFSEAASSIASCMALYGFDEDLALIGDIRSEMSGHGARTFRMELFDEPLAEHSQILKEELESVYPEAELDTISYQAADSIYQPFVLTVGVKFPSVTPVGGRILLKPCDYLSDAANNFVKGDRAGPVLFRHAYVLEETAEFRLPDGWQLEALPSDSSYRNKVGRCEVQFRDTESGFTVFRAVTLLGPYWLTDDYKSVQRLFQARQEMSDRMVVLTQN